MSDRKISVAVTPEDQGADAVVAGIPRLKFLISHDILTYVGQDGEAYFCEPHVEKMTMRMFFERLTRPPQV